MPLAIKGRLPRTRSVPYSQPVCCLCSTYIMTQYDDDEFDDTDSNEDEADGDGVFLPGCAREYGDDYGDDGRGLDLS